MSVDAMAHLDDPRVADPRAILERAAAAGVTDVITAGFDPLSVRALPPALPLAVHRAAGVHPMAIDVDHLDAQLAAVDRNPSTIAIGEIGLDARDGAPPMVVQRRAFLAQLRTAHTRGLPVIVHCVRAWGPLFECAESTPCPPGIVHGFGSSLEVLRRLAGLGWLPSFGTGVLHSNRTRTHAAAQAATRFCLESDTPDHPPEGFEQSEPSHIVKVAEALARIRGESVHAVLETATLTTQTIFGLPAVA